MFNFKYNEFFSFFINDDEGEQVKVSDWITYQDEYLSQISILNELKDNGCATTTEFTIDVASIEILKLGQTDHEILGLPEEYPYEIYIESDGQLNQPVFRFKYGFFNFIPNGHRFAIKRTGALIHLEETDYCLSENQFLICDALDEFNLLPELERTFTKNLTSFADIKSLSKNAGIILDSYLQGENVSFPDKIKIGLEYKDDILEILPELQIDDNGEFSKVFNKFKSILDVYPVQDKSGKTVRVVINSEKKIELQKVKVKRYITNKETIEDLVENPNLYFDEELIDFSIFYSDRVKEIGIYKPQFYPFICPYKSQWIPGVTIKDKIDGDKNIYFKTLNELIEFENIKETAKHNNLEKFNWNGSDIPVKDGDDIVVIGRKQFNDQKIPIEKNERLPNNQVLLIKENAELLEFDQSNEPNTPINYSFTKINNLSSSIILKEHQIDGISWLQSLFKRNLQGCLLADDMGLGKTLQILYFIEWHSQSNSYNTKPYLIVAPVSLLENWDNEYNRFFENHSLKVTLLHGGTNLTKEFNQIKNQNEVNKLQKKHIILTNYEFLRMYQATLCAVNYAFVILDEAQKIKTPGTLVTHATKALKADFKVAMTGTPVENTFIDLWSIMDFSVPGLLGPTKEFAKEFHSPLKETETDIEELGTRLRNRIGVYIKRRLKRDVAKDLPNKYDNENSRLSRVMPDVQFQRYQIEIEQANNPAITGVEYRNQILRSIAAIRDISDHPYLVDNRISEYSCEDLIKSSAKLQVTIEIVSKIQVLNEKVILFADRKETQKLLQKVIYDKFQVLVSIVNGDTPKLKQAEGSLNLSRQQTIDRYQEKEGFNAIIMSPLSAGIGLNVTQANHVIHYTRHWNPAKEMQATDRAYRIGQMKDVHVYYPMSVFPDNTLNDENEQQKSFDQILDILLEKKKTLASSTLFPSEQSEIKPDDIIESIFGLKTQSKLVPLTIFDIDKLNPNLFEAFIAALYEKQGFIVYLTPYASDKGVDVVAIGNNKNYLLQAKQTKNSVGREAIQEVNTAKKYYENKFNVKFELIVISNSNYSSTAIELSSTNDIKLICREELKILMSNQNVSIQDINYQEMKRINSI